MLETTTPKHEPDGLGGWRWYLGSASDDEGMTVCPNKATAISDGKNEYEDHEAFFIVEARMTLLDEKAMEHGDIGTAVFAETRNGEWIKP